MLKQKNVKNSTTDTKLSRPMRATVILQHTDNNVTIYLNEIQQYINRKAFSLEYNVFLLTLLFYFYNHAPQKDFHLLGLHNLHYLSIYCTSIKTNYGFSYQILS